MYVIFAIQFWVIASKSVLKYRKLDHIFLRELLYQKMKSLIIINKLKIICLYQKKEFIDENILKMRIKQFKSKDKN